MLVVEPEPVVEEQGVSAWVWVATGLAVVAAGATVALLYAGSDPDASGTLGGVRVDR